MIVSASLPPSQKPPLVCSLAYEGLCTFEYGISTELFAVRRPEFEKPLYRFKTVCLEKGPVQVMGGLSFMADGDLAPLLEADLIIIPGWRGIDALVPGRLVDTLLAAHKRGARILTICSGVFVLAATGLLDGKRATTHWRYVRALEEKYPRIRVEPNVLYVDEGQVLTSAGSAAGIDLCLYVIARQYGQHIANKMARSLVLPAHREGGQAQYVPREIPGDAPGEFEQFLSHIRQNLTRNWDVQTMGNFANLSPRTLLRRFKTHLGESPMNWLRRERLARAGELLETTDWNMDQVAHEAGFATPENFRLQFKNQYQVSPSRYRSRFRSPPMQ